MVHGFITLAAGIVLAVAPSLIPSVIGIHLDPAANVVAYLLAGAEFGLAVLSFGGSRLTDPRALRLIAWSLIAFHGSSGVLELYAFAQGVSVAILGNVVARAVIVGLFAYLSNRCYGCHGVGAVAKRASRLFGCLAYARSAFTSSSISNIRSVIFIPHSKAWIGWCPEKESNLQPFRLQSGCSTS